MVHNDNDIANAIKFSLESTTAHEIRDRLEKIFLATLMEFNNHNQSQAARDLLVTRNTLRAKLTKYGLMSVRTLRVIDREGE